MSVTHFTAGLETPRCSDDITGLLQHARAGCRASSEQLYAALLPHFRRMAERLMRGERHLQTWEPDALVNEAIVRLHNRRGGLPELRDRVALFAMGSIVMQRVLIDAARRRSASKRAGHRLASLELDALIPALERQEEVDLLDLEEALGLLKRRSSRQYEVVVLRYFGGLTMAEIATCLGVALPTVEKDWQFARAWLRRELQRN